MSASGTALLSLAMHSSSCSLDWMNMQDMWDVQWQRGPDSSLERGFVELSRAHCVITSDFDVKFQSALSCASKSCVIFRERKNALFLQFGNWQFYLICRQLTYFDSGYVSRETRLESVLISLFLRTRNFWAENVWNNLNLLVKALTFLNQLRFYQVFIWCKQEI